MTKPIVSEKLANSTLSNLNIAVVSDIHLGHRRNPTKSIISNLDIAFPNNAETAALDIIFIAGDVFDNLLSLSMEEVADIQYWIARIINICHRHSIILRILEGTKSHEWRQSALFNTINEISKCNTDAKHVKELSIEYISKFGIHVLYVPDEWESSTEKTYEQVLNLMRDKGISQVDFAIMHGQFEFQLPAFVKAQKHDSQLYLSLVKEYIFIGHIHTFSKKDRIIAQGSFDRLAHGEEEKKGHVRLYYDAVGNKKLKFIENKTAKVFKTIDCTSLAQDEILEVVDTIMARIPEDSFVRIQAEKDNPIFTTFEVLIRRYPLVTWTKQPKDIEEEDEEKNIVQEEEVFIPIRITRDNIVSLIMERVEKQAVNESVIAESRNQLLGCI